MSNVPKIKICGLTKPEEAEYLNECGVDYAGFVFYEKSKRNVTLNKADLIMGRLDDRIKKVAVTVSPDKALVERIADAGFDLI
ncbi:MAG: phosphoribosylanthranilate isomerase, partial [Lachnospiraceae bacterium]|nr:phosphoribosylanthranilate isomerase [Lachnospiraceae bacterium]